MARPQAPVLPPAQEPLGPEGPPVWVRLLLIVAFVAAFLGGMNWLLHSAPGPTVPMPTPTTMPAPVAAPIDQATRVPTPIPTPRPTLAPTATLVPTVAPTLAPAVTAALGTDWWNWSAEAIPAAQAAEAVAALDHYWAVLGTTWLDLDPRHLEETTTNPRLDDLTNLMVEDRRAGRALTLDVQRTALAVHYVDENLAVVYETYVDRSISVDSSTRKPLEPVNEVQRESSYLLWRVGGSLKVAQVAHHDN